VFFLGLREGGLDPRIAQAIRASSGAARSG